MKNKLVFPGVVILFLGIVLMSANYIGPQGIFGQTFNRLKVNFTFIPPALADTAVHVASDSVGSVKYAPQDGSIRRWNGTKWASISGGGGGAAAGAATSVASANGFAGSIVASVLTMSATPVGIIKSDGHVMSAATPDVDYATPANFVPYNGATGDITILHTIFVNTVSATNLKTNSLIIHEGDANSCMGTAQLTNGHVNISTTAVKSQSRIFIFYKSGFLPAPPLGTLTAWQINTGSSFSIGSFAPDASTVLDNNLITWVIIQPN